MNFSGIDRKKIKLWIYILVACAALRGLFFFQNLRTPLELSEELLFQVQPGVSLNQIVRELEQMNVLEHPGDLLIYARLSSAAGRVQAGEFSLSPGITPLQLLDKLLQGEVYYHQLLLVEGWTVKRALQFIQENDTIRSTLDPNNIEELQQIMGLDKHPEGQFFPDTYNFVRGTSDLEILQRANTLMKEVLEQEWARRDLGLPYTEPYEALIMASIIEKETGVAEEREQIAGVFVRRLQSGMRLQTDPTVIYGLGENYDGSLSRQDLTLDTEYNTYTNNGLPPGPIALPGRAAISASLHPEEGTSLYFVAKGDGSHYFSDSLAEHNAAVQRYLSD